MCAYRSGIKVALLEHHYFGDRGLQEQNQNLNLGGPKHEPKNFQVTWFIFKKNK